MGRIKTTFIKKRTKDLLNMHGDKFTTDFSQNKLQTDKYTNVNSKKMRNVIAGYMTRLKKQEQ